tara:strand:- start:406 stop:582 length:177 start_codon:yes stop_codon:yes gene_type:complete
MYKINQIVKGIKAGTFVVIGFRSINGEDYAQVKSVNPANFLQTSGGEFALPITAIRLM